MKSSFKVSMILWSAIMKDLTCKYLFGIDGHW